MPTKQKKSATKKSVPTKKPVQVKKAKTTKPAVTAKVAVKKEPQVKQTVVTKAPAVPVKQKKVYEISAFFHALIVLIVVLLYAEIALLGVIYFNYDVRIESKALVELRRESVKKPRLQRRVIIQQVKQPKEVQ